MFRHWPVSSSNLPETHVKALEPHPGEQQREHHVGEGKSKPRGKVHNLFTVRKQSERETLGLDAELKCRPGPVCGGWGVAES
jgi:hypothetical protein